MQKTEYDLAVFVGRFQPPCRHHIDTLKHGLQQAETVVVFVGSANSPRSIKNPFTAEERIEMIRSCLSLEEVRRVVFCPKEDSLYDDNQWIAGIEYNVDKVLYNIKGPVDTTKVCLIGCDSDHTSWYLDKFPLWDKKFVEAKEANGAVIHATDIRNNYLNGSDWCFDEHAAHYLYAAVEIFMRKFRKTEEFKRLTEEYDMIRKYKESWKDAPYPPTFVCVDAVVVQSANVLLVRRGASPGKGLYALPGGFVEQNERISVAAVRELREETRIDVPPGKLFNCIKRTEVFDHPERSLRGRTITHAFLIELNEQYGQLPFVKGGDDAAKAEWIPFSELVRMRGELFEDHWDIINHMVGGLMSGTATPVIFGSNNLNR